MLIQFQLGAACNALPPVEARIARWLLHFRDRIDHDVLPLTQEALSEILGVRRTTVTLLIRNLRASGAIRTDRRGQIEITSDFVDDRCGVVLLFRCGKPLTFIEECLVQ